MGPIEILNTISEKVFELRKTEEGADKEKKFLPFEDPKDFKEDTTKRINGQLTEVSKEEHLKDCIGHFLINALALKNKDLLKGHTEARQLVKTHNGFGMVDDIRFKEITGPMSSKTHRIRIFGEGKSMISNDEKQDIAYWGNVGDYVIVKNMDEFYQWYSNKFGVVKI